MPSNVTVNANPGFALSGWNIWPGAISINICANGVSFELLIDSNSYFINSPKALSRFHDYFAIYSLTTNATGKADEVDVKRYLGSKQYLQFQQYLGWIAEISFLDMKHLAPPVKHVGTVTLDQLLSFQRSYESRTIFIDESPHSLDLRPSTKTHKYKLEIYTNRSPFPLFLPSEVEVPYGDPINPHGVNAIPVKVLVGNRPLFFKPAWCPAFPIEKIEKHAKFARSGLSAGDLSTQRLYGVVLTKYGELLGLMYHWMDFREGITLEHVVHGKTTISLLHKWTDQTADTLGKLHELGVVWGDAREEHVLVDSSDDAVLV
jgi:hypothetical protein